MIIRFTLGRSRRDSALPLFDDPGMRLETHPSGLNRTDARRLSAREIAHREQMLRHLHRTLYDSNSPFPAR